MNRLAVDSQGLRKLEKVAAAVVVAVVAALAAAVAVEVERHKLATAEATAEARVQAAVLRARQTVWGRHWPESRLRELLRGV